MVKNNVFWLYLHFEAVIIGVNGLIQPKTVNQVKLQPGGCTQAVVCLYIFAVQLQPEYSQWAVI